MGRYAAVSSPLPLVAGDDLAPFAFVNVALIAPVADRVVDVVRRMDVAADRYRAALVDPRERTPRSRIAQARRIADRFDAHP